MVLQHRQPPYNRVNLRPSETLEVRPIAPSQSDPRMGQIFRLLLTSASCLLLVAGANVVNLELTFAVTRARWQAVALALGASPRSLFAAAAVEGALLVAAAALVGAGLAALGLRALTALLPAAVTSSLANPLDVDGRTFAFLLGVSATVWLLAELPVALGASRTNMLRALRFEGRSMSGSLAGAWIRRALTVVEVATTVALLVGATLTARSYAALLGIPKGFDVEGIAAIDVAQRPGSSEKASELSQRLAHAWRARPDVLYAAPASGIPPGRGGAINAGLSISGRDGTQGQVTVAGYGVDPQFFSAMRLPLIAGRAFMPDDSSDAVVIDEGFARRYWPDGSALGAHFSFGGSRFNSGSGQYVVVGIAQHMRTSEDSATAASAESFPIYFRLEDGYSPLSFVLRLTDPTRLDDVVAMARTLAPDARIRAEFIRDRYAAMFSNEMIAASIMSVFSGLAFVVAIAGIYAVMAFLVASRTREIGIRVALGADRGRIQRLVLGGSLALVVAGAVIGGAAAFAGARWAASLLVGVSPTDPWTYAGVTISVTLAALIATWQPARAAAAVDPTILLRD
jgi:predicted permease